MNPTPLVSVCIPTHNGSRYLMETLESVNAQTYPHLEVLISDDASTDGTLELVQQFQAMSRFPVTVTRHEVLGLVHNWNFAARQAHGEFVKFVFQDDTIEPECIARLVERGMEDPAIGLVFSPRRVILDAEAMDDPMANRILAMITDIHREWADLRPVQSGRRLLADRKLIVKNLNKIGEPSVVLLRREAINRVGMFDPTFVQLVDAELWLRIMARYKVGFVDAELSTFRLHAKMQTRRNLDVDEVIQMDQLRLYWKLLEPPIRDMLDWGVREELRESVIWHHKRRGLPWEQYYQKRTSRPMRFLMTKWWGAKSHLRRALP